MNVYRISAAGIERHREEELNILLSGQEGFVWVDFPECDESAARMLSEVFQIHPLALQNCRERHHFAKAYVYPDHLFVILQTPEPAHAGHIHRIELDQFIGRRYLLTLHGPLGEGVSLDLALRHTRTALTQMERNGCRPSFPVELSHTIVSAQVRYMEDLVSALARKIAAIERRVIKGAIAKPEQLLEEMFQLRHELLTIQTMGGHSQAVYARLTTLAKRILPPKERPFMEDLANQFEHIRSVCETELAFLQGVIDYYQNRVITKLNVATERLALVSALMLPITAIASVYGMNIIVNETTQFFHLAGVLGGIGAITLLMLIWAKRQSWW